MDLVLASKPPCPGLRFYPTDEELLMYYLKRKVMSKTFPYQMMSEVDVYRYAPWDLPHMSSLKTKDLYWYFFCPRLKKYPNGAKTHRLTEFGYWKSTGMDRVSNYRGRPVGKIKTLVFHQGKPPGGDRTDWVMHEYKLEDQVLANKGVSLDSYVICKIFQKSGVGPKNGEHYGAPFVEEEWENDDDDANANAKTEVGPALHPENVSPADNNLNGLNTFVGLTPSCTEQLTPSATTEQTVPLGIQQVNPFGQPIDNNDFFNGLEDLEVNGFHSTAHLPLSSVWPSYGGYMKLSDLTPSYTEQLTPSATTEQTVPLRIQQANTFDQPINDNFFNGLEDLEVNGFHSTAHPPLLSSVCLSYTEYVEMDDFFNSLQDVDGNRTDDSYSDYMNLSDLN